MKGSGVDYQYNMGSPAIQMVDEEYEFNIQNSHELNKQQLRMHSNQSNNSTFLYNNFNKN